MHFRQSIYYAPRVSARRDFFHHEIMEEGRVNPPNTFGRTDVISLGVPSLAAEESLEETPDVRKTKRKLILLREEDTLYSSISPKDPSLLASEEMLIESPFESKKMQRILEESVMASPEKKKTKGEKEEATPTRISPRSTAEETSEESSPSSDVKESKPKSKMRRIQVQFFNYKAVEIRFARARDFSLEPSRINPDVITMGTIPLDQFRPHANPKWSLLVLETIERHVDGSGNISYRRDCSISFIFEISYADLNSGIFIPGLLMPLENSMTMRKDGTPIKQKMERTMMMDPREFAPNRDITALQFYYGPELTVRVALYTYIPADTVVEFHRTVPAERIEKGQRVMVNVTTKERYITHYGDDAERYWDEAAYLDIPLSMMHNEPTDANNIFAKFYIDVNTLSPQISENFSPRFKQAGNSALLIFIKRQDVFERLYNHNLRLVRVFGFSKEDIAYESKLYPKYILHELVPLTPEEIQTRESVEQRSFGVHKRLVHSFNASDKQDLSVFNDPKTRKAMESLKKQYPNVFKDQ